MAEGDSFMRTAMFMRDNGKMIRYTDEVCTPTMMDPATPVSGRKTYSMGLASRSGVMVLPMKGKLSSI